MYFTKEDFIKIHNWLKANSVKDTDFIPADIPTHIGDTVAIVQDGINKQLPLAYLRLSFKLCTHEEYEELVRNGLVDPEIIYGLLTADGATVDLIFFGYIPFAIHGATRSLDHAEQWVIETDIDGYTKEVGTSDIESKVISYKGDTLTIHYNATRQLIYKWSDDRPNTVETEYGKVSFVINPNGTESSPIVTWENLLTEDNAFAFNIVTNNGTAKRELKVTPKIYGESTKTTFTDSNHIGLLVQGMAYIYMQNQFETDSTAKTLTIEVSAIGYPSSDMPIINNQSIQVVKGKDYIDNISVIQVSGNPLTYNLKVELKANSTNTSRDIQIKVNDLKEGSKLSSTTTIKQSGVGTVSISGIQLSNIKGYIDAEHTQRISDPITVPYGKSKTIYLVADEGYILPEDSKDIIVSPENTSFTYNKSTGAVTFNALTKDVTMFKVNAYQFGYYMYENLAITKFEYPEFGGAEEDSTTSCSELAYTVDKIEYYTYNGKRIKKRYIGVSPTADSVLFSFTAKDSSNNTITDKSTVATINPSTGTLTWKLNGSGQNNIITVKVEVLFVGTGSSHTRLIGEATDTIIQPYATRTVTVNATKSKGLKLTLEGTTGNTVSVPYGLNVEITVSAKENYRVPSVSEISSHLSVTPEGGYLNYKYNISEATGKNTLQIFNITSNISVIMTGVEKTVTLPIYCGVLTPQDSGFTSKQPTSAITDTILEAALGSGALEAVDNLPRTKDNPYIMEVTTKYSYVIGLIPTSGRYANYIIKQDSGLRVLIALTYGGETGYALNGERTVNIQGNSYKLYAVYLSAKEGKKYTYKWVIFENN